MNAWAIWVRNPKIPDEFWPFWTAATLEQCNIQFWGGEQSRPQLLSYSAIFVDVTLSQNSWIIYFTNIWPYLVSYCDQHNNSTNFLLILSHTHASKYRYGLWRSARNQQPLMLWLEETNGDVNYLGREKDHGKLWALVNALMYILSAFIK